MAKNKERILAVDDEEDIRVLVKYSLEKENFEVRTAPDGETALSLARSWRPNLVVLDLMLPGIDGREVCYRLKRDEELQHIPVVMLTARTEESDEIIGLGIGADDYIKKPFSPGVLVARVQAALRRQQQAWRGDEAEPPVVTRGPLTVNPAQYRVTLSGEEVKLTPIEFKILYFLARHPGRVYSRDQIIDAAQGEDVIISTRTIDVHMVSLRKKLGEWASTIETVRGFGYRFAQ